MPQKEKMNSTMTTAMKTYDFSRYPTYLPNNTKDLAVYNRWKSMGKPCTNEKLARRNNTWDQYTKWYTEVNHILVHALGLPVEIPDYVWA